MAANRPVCDTLMRYNVKRLKEEVEWLHSVKNKAQETNAKVEEVRHRVYECTGHTHAHTV